jgi:hypothetical protein
VTRLKLAAVIAAGIANAVFFVSTTSAQHTASLAGTWTLNCELSQFPREVGFGADLVQDAPGSDSAGGRGRGRSRSGGGTGGFPSRRESEDDVARAQKLTSEVRSPSARLTVVETGGSVTVTDDRGLSRAFHPDGKEQVIRIGELPVAVVAKWEAGRLVVVYRVEEGRELRYTYARNENPPQIVVDVRFVERGGSDSIRRVYQASSESAANTGSASSLAAPPCTTIGTGAPSRAAATQPATTKPASDPPQTPAAAVPAAPSSSEHGAPQTFAQQPGAELKGLQKLGLVVEDLDARAATCGLNRGAIEAAVSKSLSDAGLEVRQNSDEDTYVYVSIITTNTPTGLCVSRYDAFLYTHTTARLSYQQAPVLVQVSLLHQGGMSGGSMATHAADVLKAVKLYVDQFAAQIRAANK